MQSRAVEDLMLGGELLFDCPILEGGCAVFYSSSVDLVPDFGHIFDGTMVNLLSSDKDILLHVCARRAQNAVVFNSKPRGGDWQSEERVPLAGVFGRADATIVIRRQLPNWLVYADGHLIKTFEQRSLKPAVAVAYKADVDRRPVFSNPLHVTLAVEPSLALPTIVRELMLPIALGSKLSLSRPIAEGDGVVLYSASVDLVPESGHIFDGTMINLLSNEHDILLHVCVRRAQNAIVFNSKPRGGAWQSEERVSLAGVFGRTDATVVVRRQASDWLVLVDGRLIKTSQRRIDKPATAVAYSADIGRRPVFSVPLHVALAAAS